MLKQVLETACDNMTGIDKFILVVGILSMIFISFLATVKIFGRGRTDRLLLKICLELSSLYQYGIEACPLLGTLGTVVSLIANSIHPLELESNFLYALTSTFWGLVMALVCKALESIFRLNGYFEAKAEQEGIGK